MIMVKFTYTKGVYMLVSAVSLTNCQTIFSNDNKPKINDYYADTAFNSLNSKKIINERQSKVFDSINEWKNFCHQQIEQGKLDVIV